MALTGVFAVGQVACLSSSDQGANQAADTASPDGAEFVTVPVPGDNCRSIVLRGTTRFKGRAYVMPQPYIAANAQGVKLLQTMPKGNGYVVRIGVYFPAGAGDTSGQAQTLFAQLPDCKYEDIQTVVNKNLPEDQKIGYPEPLSVNFVKVGLQGVSTPYLFGHEGTGILSYSGHDYIAEFDVPDQVSLADFLGRLRSSLGIQLTFDFNFGARSTDGFAQVQIDHTQVATRVDAALSAGGVVYGVMAAAQFELAVANALSQTSVNVYIEPSKRDQAFNDIAKQLVAKLILDNPDLRPAQLPGNLDSGLPAAATDDAGAGAGSVLGALVPRVDARAAVQRMRQQATATYRFEQATAIEQKTYTTNALLRSSWAAPGQEYLRAYSDGADSTYMYSRNVNKGDVLTISPSSRTTEDVNYTQNSTYFQTKDEIIHGPHDMLSRFPYLMTYQRSLVQSGNFPLYVNDGYYTSFWNWKYRMWGYTSGTANYANSTTARFELNDPGVRVQFAGATSFALADLATNNDAWEGRVDSVLGTVTMVAKRDLQQLRLRNADQFDKTEIYPVRHFQRKLNGSNELLEETFSDRDQPQQLPTKRSVVQIVVQSAPNGLAQIDPTSVSVNPGSSTSPVHTTPQQNPQPGP